MVGYLVDNLCIHNDLILNDQVRDVFPDHDLFVKHIKTGLLSECNPPQPKLHNKSILIRLFKQSMTQPI